MVSLESIKGRTTPVGKTIGIVEYLESMQLALSGDMVLSVSPATLGSSATAINAAIGGTAAKFTRKVAVRLQSSAGYLHAWFSGTFSIAATKSSTNGVVAIKDGATTATFVDGIAEVILEYTGTWVAADTQTLTVTGGTKLGYTIANKTSVDTLIA